MSVLPEDVVAVDTTKKSLLFYVAPDDNDVLRLSYLESPDNKGTGHYKVVKIVRALDRESEDAGKYDEIRVSPENKQVAAVTWVENNVVEIRVYYVGQTGKQHRLREVCKTGDGDWYIGSFGHYGNKIIQPRPSTFISASVHSDPKKGYNLRVFAAGIDEEYKKRPRIAAYKFVRDAAEPNSEPRWSDAGFITDKIEEY